MSTFKFYWAWFQLGRSYWKSRHIWTLMAYVNQPSTPPPSLDDELAAWIAAQDDEDAA